MVQIVSRKTVLYYIAAVEQGCHGVLFIGEVILKKRIKSSKVTVSYFRFIS